MGGGNSNGDDDDDVDDGDDGDVLQLYHKKSTRVLVAMNRNGDNASLYTFFLQRSVIYS